MTTPADGPDRGADEHTVLGRCADEELLARIRSGEEQAFVALVTRHHASMVRLARSFVPSLTVAEDVAQDAWVGVLRGIEKFEGRSSFKTWLMHIVVNRARTTGLREHRSIPIGDPVGAVDQGRFDRGGQWASPPEHWVERIDDRIQADQMVGTIRLALDDLPPNQRAIVTLRDIEGLGSKEVCEMLEISEGNQRVLLHRARSSLRQSLETTFGRS
jgi:RNA polymerase sigma-70 factor, ECF subfamily